MTARLFAELDRLPDGNLHGFYQQAHLPAETERCGWCFKAGVGFDHLDPTTGRYSCEQGG